MQLLVVDGVVLGVPSPLVFWLASKVVVVVVVVVVSHRFRCCSLFLFKRFYNCLSIMKAFHVLSYIVPIEVTGILNAFAC